MSGPDLLLAEVPWAALLGRDVWCFSTTACQPLDRRGVAIGPAVQMGRWTDVGLTAAGEPVVARYDGQIAFRRGGNWEFGSCAATPMALACDGETVWVGDSAGRLTAWGPGGARLETTLDAPVVAMRGVSVRGASVRVVLDQRGRLWLHEGGAPRRVSGASAAMGVCAGGHRLGVHGRDWVGTVDAETSEVRALPVPFEVREWISGGPDGAWWARSDGGELFRVSAELSRAEPVRLPGDASAVRGISVGSASTLVWTATGGLFRVGAGGVRPIAQGVRFAVADAFRVSCPEGGAPVVVAMETP